MKFEQKPVSQVENFSEATKITPESMLSTSGERAYFETCYKIMNLIDETKALREDGGLVGSYEETMAELENMLKEQREINADKIGKLEIEKIENIVEMKILAERKAADEIEQKD